MNTTTIHQAENLTWLPAGTSYETWSADSRYSATVRNTAVYGFVFAPEGAPGPEVARGVIGGGWSWEVWNEDDEIMVSSGMESTLDAAKDACARVIPAPVW